MCTGMKKCKACAAAQIGKTMAKRTKRTAKNIAMDVVYYSGGAVAGAYVLPKILETVDPSGKLDSKIVNGGTAALAVLGAMNVKSDPVKKLLVGAAVGSTVQLVTEVMAMNGLGYVINPNTNLENVISGARDSRYNAGDL